MFNKPISKIKRFFLREDVTVLLFISVIIGLMMFFLLITISTETNVLSYTDDHLTKNNTTKYQWVEEQTNNGLHLVRKKVCN